MSTVLVVEASDVMRHSMVAALRAHGHHVKGLPGAVGLELALDQLQPELIVLDALLPGERNLADALGVIRRRSRASVILLSGPEQEPLPDQIGDAVDRLAKPFAMEELAARVERLSRGAGGGARTVAIGDLVVSVDGSQVSRNGVSIDLTDTERRLLAQLAKVPDRVVSKTQLLSEVWGYDGYDENIVEVHISSLRRRLEAHGPRVIHTLRGQGYRLGSA